MAGPRWRTWASQGPAPASRQILEAASWRVAAELTRRHPGLMVLETQPGGGQSDCLTLFERAAPDWSRRIHLNREGSAHTSRFDNPSTEGDEIWLDFWSEYLGAEDPLPVIRELERRAALQHSGKLASTTAEVLTYRAIAAIVGAVFGRHRVECRSGRHDWRGVEREWFDAFPGAGERLGVRQAGDFLEEPAFRFWFLLVDEVPRLCFEITGRGWNRNGTRSELLDAYVTADRRLWPVVVGIATDILD